MNKAKKAPTAVTVGGVTVRIHRQTNREAINHVVTWWEGGGRQRKSMTDEGAAKAFARATAERLAGAGGAVLTLSAEETGTYRQLREQSARWNSSLNSAFFEWEEAKRILGGGSVVEAARFFASRGDVRTTPEVPAAVAEFLATKRQAERSVRHVDDLESRLNRFAESFRIPLGRVTAGDIRAWVVGLKDASGEPLSARTRNNYLAAISSLVQWAVKGRKVSAGQIDMRSIDRFGEEVGEVSILTPEQMRDILANARDEIVPFIAVGGFAGVRSAELLRMTWSQVKFDEAKGFPHGWLELKASQSKNAKKLGARARRLIPMSANLHAWLKARAKGEDDKVCPFIRYDKLTNAVARIVGIPWENNCLRHSYGSYRLAQTHDENKVAMEMGNSPAMIFAHYRQLVTPEQAEKWFSIMP